MEGRWLLSGSPVNIDRSGDPSADTITVGTSGSNTVIDVNGNQVYSGASSNISSLSITGTAYNDKIEFNYDGGNPVPNGYIGVGGAGGTNELDVTGNSNITLAGYVQLWGNISSTINYGYITKIVATAASPSDQANVLAADSSPGKFYGHLAAAAGQGPGANYQADNGGSYNNIAIGFDTVYAFSSNASDVAYLDDYYAGVNNATAHPTISVFGTSRLEDVVNTFATVHFLAGDPQDQATLDDQNNTSAATANYSPMYGTFSGPGYQYTASNFPTTTMKGYNSSDAISLYDTTNAPGTFTTFPTYSSVAGTDNGTIYQATGSFAHVYENPATYTPSTGWYDNLGGASVAVNSYDQPYISFSNGVAVTFVQLPNSAGNIMAYNQSSPLKTDYATASAEWFVILEGNGWQVDPHE